MNPVKLFKVRFNNAGVPTSHCIHSAVNMTTWEENLRTNHLHAGWPVDVTVAGGDLGFQLM